MAQHVFTNGDGRAHRKDVTVLVTGFGPFQERFPINPSFEIARSLPETLPSPASYGSKIQIISYGTPIRVCYEEVRELVPPLHEAYAESVDLILHIGMASGRQFYAMERYAHRDGYNKNKDLDGETLPPDDGLRRFGDCPAKMTTSLDYERTLAQWKMNIMNLPDQSSAADADCRRSDDAGHYLCDYLYFNSLAWFGRRHGKLEGGRGSDRPVLFLHVPAESSSDMIQKGTQVAAGLIEAMVDTWLHSKQNGII